MNTLAKEFKAAFGSVWALIGILISSVAVFNWVSSVLKIGLSSLFAQLLGAFRSLFHPIIEVLTGWAIPWLPFLALPEWKDGLVLWFAMGGAVARASFPWVQASRLPSAMIDSLNEGVIQRPIHKDLPRPVRIIFLLFSAFLWPIALGVLASRPIAVHAGSGWSKSRGPILYISYTKSALAAQMNQSKALYDLRIVFGIHLVAVIAGAVILLLLSAAGAD